MVSELIHVNFRMYNSDNHKKKNFLNFTQVGFEEKSNLNAPKLTKK